AAFTPMGFACSSGSPAKWISRTGMSALVGMWYSIRPAGSKLSLIRRLPLSHTIDILGPAPAKSDRRVSGEYSSAEGGDRVLAAESWIVRFRRDPSLESG